MWDPVSIDSDTTYSCLIGGVQIWIKHSQMDWHVSYEATEYEDWIQPLSTVSDEQALDDKSWSRWISGNEALVVRLVPVLPDRPVVVRTQHPIKVPIRYKALFHVHVPVWTRIGVGEEPPLFLSEIPTTVLTKSWFGDPVSGEACYALRTSAVRDLSQLETRRDCVVCPVYVNNQSNQVLDFQRLCLHVENLSVFKSASRLLTNAVNVKYRGDGQMSQVDLDEAPPAEMGPFEMLSGPRKRLDKSIVQRSFQVFKLLTTQEGS